MGGVVVGQLDCAFKVEKSMHFFFLRYQILIVQCTGVINANLIYVPRQLNALVACDEAAVTCN